MSRAIGETVRQIVILPISELVYIPYQEELRIIGSVCKMVTQIIVPGLLQAGKRYTRTLHIQ
jgi:hypothetical protein